MPRCWMGTVHPCNLAHHRRKQRHAIRVITEYSGRSPWSEQLNNFQDHTCRLIPQNQTLWFWVQSRWIRLLLSTQAKKKKKTKKNVLIAAVFWSSWNLSGCKTLQEFLLTSINIRGIIRSQSGIAKDHWSSRISFPPRYILNVPVFRAENFLIPVIFTCSFEAALKYSMFKE